MRPILVSIEDYKATSGMAISVNEESFMIISFLLICVKTINYL